MLINVKFCILKIIINTQNIQVCHERDLRITIYNDLKQSKHCSDIVKTANKLVSFIGRAFE